MRRVMIVGGSGSGKNTLANAVGSVPGLPVHHMDHTRWTPDWHQRPRPERTAMARMIKAQDARNFECGFSTNCDPRAARAGTLIWPDPPVVRRMGRVTRRLVRYCGRKRIGRFVTETGPGLDIVHLYRPVQFRDFLCAAGPAA